MSASRADSEECGAPAAPARESSPLNALTTFEGSLAEPYRERQPVRPQRVASPAFAYGNRNLPRPRSSVHAIEHLTVSRSYRPSPHCQFSHSCFDCSKLSGLVPCAVDRFDGLVSIEKI